MAYQRLTATSSSTGYQRLTGTGTPGLVAAPAAPVAPQPESLLHKILGAAAQVIVPVNIPHLLTDVKDTAVGIGSLVGEGFHDVGRGAAQVLPGRQDWGIVEDNPADSYHVDDIAKGLVGFAPQAEGGGYHPLNNGILGDYWKRYGPLLPGGAPASETYQSFRAHPLSFILDAVGAASAVGKGADIAAKGAVGADEAAAAVAASTTDELVSGGIHAATAEQAGTRAGLDALAESGAKLTPAQELARKLLPQATYRFEGDKLVRTAEIRNPLLRAAATPIKNALSEPTSALAERAAAGEDQIAKLLNIGVEPTGKLVSDTKVLSDIASQAASHGLSRVDRPFLRDAYYPWRHSADVLADMGAQHLLHRETAALPYREAIATAIAKDPTVADTFHLTATGLDVNIPGLEAQDWAKARVAEAEALTPRTASLAGPLEMMSPGAVLDEVGASRVGDLVDTGTRNRGIVDELQRSMADTGYQDTGSPITIIRNADGSSVISDGAHRLKAADAAGIQNVPVRVVDAGGGLATATRPFVDTMDPALHAAAQDATPAIAQRTDVVIAKIDELTQRLQTDGEALSASGWDVPAELEGAQRLKRALNDGLARQAAAARGESVDAGTVAADQIRLIDAEKYADVFPVMGHTPKEIVDRAYFPLRFKYGAKFEGNDIVTGPSVGELDNALHDAGHAQPVYFPYIDATTAKPADFFRSRQLKGANVFAKDPHAKQLKGVLLKEGTYIEDPVEAYTRRASRAVREIETYNTFSTLTKTFGRKISNAEDVPTGWRVVAPDQLFLQHRTRLEFLDALDTLRSQGVDSDAALSQVLDRVMLRNTEDVTKALHGGSDLWAVPEHVAKQMERASDLAKVVGSTTVQLAWDTPMKAWRGLVLTASPRWVVNNILGNTTFALMQGVKTADVLRIATERFRSMLAGWLESKGGTRAALGEFLGGRDLREGSLAAEVQKLPGAEDVGGGFTGTFQQQYVPHLGEKAANTAVGKAITRVQESKAATKIRSWGDAVKHLNSEIESSYREASYLTAIEKMQGKSAITRAGRSFWDAKSRMESIMSDGFNESKAKLALDEVNHFFGDYTRMTPFERHVVRRFIFPFWGFYRHQIKLLVTYPFDYPGRAIVLSNLGKVHEEMMKQYGPLPSWLDGAVPLGPPGSEVSFFTTRGSDPFSGTFQPPTEMLSPIIKMALEQATGRSLYNGQPFTDRNVIENYGGMRIDTRTGQEAGNTAPGILEALLRNVPQYQELEQGLAGGKTYDTANLIDILSGQGAQTDATGAPKYPTDAGEQLMKLLGMSTTDYNLGGYQSYLAAQQEMAAKALAQRSA